MKLRCDVIMRVVSSTVPVQPPFICWNIFYSDSSFSRKSDPENCSKAVQLTLIIEITIIIFLIISIRIVSTKWKILVTHYRFRLFSSQLAERHSNVFHVGSQFVFRIEILTSRLYPSYNDILPQPLVLYVNILREFSFLTNKTSLITDHW